MQHVLFVVCQPAQIITVKDAIVQSIDWWESMDHDALKEEGRHGAHYWCPSCWQSGLSVLVRDGVAVAMSPTKATTASNVPSKSADCNPSPYRARAKSTCKKSTSSKLDSVQRVATPNVTKPKRSMSCAKHSISPGKNHNLKSSGPNNLLPPAKKQRRATSQGKNSRKKVY
jgi:hypothetical protein